jgi:hypothetical protein
MNTVHDEREREHEHSLPASLRRIIDVGGEELDELLYYYPTPEDDGVTRERLPRARLRHGADHFTGVILGYGTSYEEAHSHVPGARPTQRCSGCRWTDVTILWACPVELDGSSPPLEVPTAPEQYCVIVRGRTILDGETQRVRMTWTSDPDAVLDALHVPVPRHLRVTGRERNVAGPHEDALLDAASLDEPLADVANAFMRDREAVR